MLTALGNIICSTILIIIGIFLNRFFESRPKLSAYFSHVGSGRVRIGNDTPVVFINTHSLVIFNAARKPALNVRIGHYPHVRDVQNMIAVFPQQQFRVDSVTDGGEEIILERVLPKQSITITYIYGGLTADQITAYVRSNEVEAKFLPVTINRQYPSWFLNLIRLIMFVGFVTSVYYVYLYVMILFKYLNWIH